MYGERFRDAQTARNPDMLQGAGSQIERSHEIAFKHQRWVRCRGAIHYHIVQFQVEGWIVGPTGVLIYDECFKSVEM